MTCTLAAVASADSRRSIGAAIRIARVRRGWSQDRLGEVTGMDRGFISGVERGSRNPTMTTLERIAQALGMSLSQLMAAADEERARMQDRGGQSADGASHDEA